MVLALYKSFSWENVQISINDQHCWMKALSNWLKNLLRVTDSNGKLLGNLTHTHINTGGERTIQSKPNISGIFAHCRSNRSDSATLNTGHKTEDSNYFSEQDEIMVYLSAVLQIFLISG